MTNSIKTNRIKERICNIKGYRQKQIQKIFNVWKTFANIEPAWKDPMDNILNLIQNSCLKIL